MWVTTTDLPTAASHPFYRRLNQLLRDQRELLIVNETIPAADLPTLSADAREKRLLNLLRQRNDSTRRAITGSLTATHTPRRRELG